MFAECWDRVVTCTHKPCTLGNETITRQPGTIRTITSKYAWIADRLTIRLSTRTASKGKLKNNRYQPDSAGTPQWPAGPSRSAWRRWAPCCRRRRCCRSAAGSVHSCQRTGRPSWGSGAHLLDLRQPTPEFGFDLTRGGRLGSTHLPGGEPVGPNTGTGSGLATRFRWWPLGGARCAASDLDDDDDGVSPFLPRKNSMKYFYISCTHSGARGEHTTVATTMVCVCARYTRIHTTHTQTQTCAGDVNTHTAAARSALSFLLLLSLSLSLTHSLTIATILLAHFGLIGERVIRKFFDFNILYFACIIFPFFFLVSSVCFRVARKF